MRIVQEEHRKEVDYRQKMDLHSVTMGNEHYTMSNKMGKGAFKDIKSPFGDFMEKMPFWHKIS